MSLPKKKMNKETHSQVLQSWTLKCYDYNDINDKNITKKNYVYHKTKHNG